MNGPIWALRAVGMRRLIRTERGDGGVPTVRVHVHEIGQCAIGGLDVRHASRVGPKKCSLSVTGGN